MIDNDCLTAPLGLRALARIVDDERVEMRHWSQNRVRKALSR